MSTKTEIQAHINAELASGSNIPASKHRGVLGTDDDSFLENVYGTAVTESEDTVNTITSANAGWEYNATFTKQGRFVTVDYFIKNVSGATVSNGQPFSIVDTEYQHSGNTYGFGTLGNGVIPSGITSPLEIGQSQIQGNNFIVRADLLDDDFIRGQIKYNTIS